MSEIQKLQAVAEAVSGAPVRNDVLAERMRMAREAQERTSIQLEDLAREIATDEAELAKKYERFNAICGEIIETPERIQGQR